MVIEEIWQYCASTLEVVATSSASATAWAAAALTGAFFVWNFVRQRRRPPYGALIFVAAEGYGVIGAAKIFIATLRGHFEHHLEGEALLFLIVGCIAILLVLGERLLKAFSVAHKPFSPGHEPKTSDY